MLDIHDKHQDLPPRPEDGFAIDSSVQERAVECLGGLWRVKVVLWENGKQKKINGFDLKPPPKPQEAPPEDEAESIVERIYNFAYYRSEREGRRIHCKAMFWQRKSDEDEFVEGNPDGQVQFNVIADSVDDDDAPELLNDVASVTGVIGAITPMMNAVVAPMIKSVAEDRKVVHQMIQALQSQQGSLNSLLLVELSKGYENQTKTTKAIVGARESELESRKIATEMFTEGIRMRGQIMNERHEMIELAHEAEVTRLKDEKRHAERMDMLKQFGPSIAPFLGGIMENITAAFARGREQARTGATNPSQAPQTTPVPQATPAPPPWPPPSGTPGPAKTVSPPVQPTAPPDGPAPFQAVLHPVAGMLRRFGALMRPETWEAMSKEFSGDQISLLRKLCSIDADNLVSGAFVQFYETFPAERTERLGQYVSEEQGDLFMRAAEFATNAIQATRGVTPQASASPPVQAQVIDMTSRQPQPEPPPPTPPVEAAPEPPRPPEAVAESPDEEAPPPETVEPEVLDEAPSRRRKKTGKKRTTKKTTKK